MPEIKGPGPQLAGDLKRAEAKGFSCGLFLFVLVTAKDRVSQRCLVAATSSNCHHRQPVQSEDPGLSGHHSAITAL